MADSASERILLTGRPGLLEVIWQTVCSAWATWFSV